MGFKNHRGHKDSNHSALVQTAKSVGASVAELHTVGNSLPDLLTHLFETVLIEVKTADGQFSIAQLRFLAEWKGYSGFVSNDYEMIRLLRNPKSYSLSERDKSKIMKIVLSYENKTKAKNPRIDVSRFEELFMKV